MPPKKPTIESLAAAHEKLVELLTKDGSGSGAISSSAVRTKLTTPRNYDGARGQEWRDWLAHVRRWQIKFAKHSAPDRAAELMDCLREKALRKVEQHLPSPDLQLATGTPAIVADAANGVVAAPKTPSGEERILEILTKAYGEEQVITDFQDIEDFDTLKRGSGVALEDYLNEFEGKAAKATAAGSTYSDKMMSMKLLASSCISKPQKTAILQQCTIHKREHDGVEASYEQVVELIRDLGRAEAEDGDKRGKKAQGGFLSADEKTTKPTRGTPTGSKWTSNEDDTDEVRQLKNVVKSLMGQQQKQFGKGKGKGGKGGRTPYAGPGPKKAIVKPCTQCGRVHPGKCWHEGQTRCTTCQRFHRGDCWMKGQPQNTETKQENPKGTGKGARNP